MKKHQSVALIGGGVVGASCALALAREGYRVTVLEKGNIGHGCSWGNGAQFNAGSSLPMAYPGVAHQAIKWLINANGPIRIAPREFTRVLPWLIRFLNTARLRRWEAAYDGLHALNSQCAALYREMLGEPDWNRHFRMNGALHVFRDEFAGPLDEIVDAMRLEKGVRFERITVQDVWELEPKLSRDYRRGIFFPDSGHVVSPVGLVEGLMQRATALGTKVQKATVFAVAPGSNAVTLQTSLGAQAFDYVVVAAGFASRDLARSLDVCLPLASERGYHITMKGVANAISRPVTDAALAFVATPLSEGLRVVGIAEFEAPGALPDPRQSKKLQVSARTMLPEIPLGEMRDWVGVRPSTPDSLPLIDRHPRHPSVFFATGHGHMGISGAPMTAALISDLIAAREPRIRITPYRLR